MSTYKLIWDDFCSWLLEIVKPAYQQPIDAKTYKAIITHFEDLLKVLHPFMPFLTEEIWQLIKERTPEEALIISKWPEKEILSKESNFNRIAVLATFSFVQDVVSGIRTIRKQKNIAFKDAIELHIINNLEKSPYWDSVISKLGNIEAINYVDEAVEGALTFRVKSNEYFVPMQGSIDVEAEIEKLTEELKYTEGFLKSVQGKLSNERFVNNAPEQVVASEKKKEADALAKIETLKYSLVSLK